MENTASIAGMLHRNFWRILGWGSAVALILTPLIAMQFTREVQWSAMDFGFAILMFGSVGLMLELAVRKTRNGYYRIGAAFALLAGFMEIWANGAVGIVGDEGNPVNLLFVGIVLCAIAGTMILRGRARPMATLMFGLAGVQMVAAVVTYAIFWDKGSLFTLVFAALWALSGISFVRVARG